VPPGIAVDAKAKDVDRAIEALLAKPNELLTTDEVAFLRAESLRVLREGW
jgi:hypothetical protein